MTRQQDNSLRMLKGSTDAPSAGQRTAVRLLQAGLQPDPIMDPGISGGQVLKEHLRPLPLLQEALLREGGRPTGNPMIGQELQVTLGVASP